MQKAAELIRQGKNEEAWQMCCGYLKLDLEQFMSIQKSLLLGQIELLNRSVIGRKLMKGAIVRTVDDFRRQVPLTTYADYCPELSERQENTLPVKPVEWIHTSGKSGEYSCKWVPMTQAYIQNISPLMYGIGLISSSKGWGDSSHMPPHLRIMYTVAPRPYMSGALANLISLQTPLTYYPSIEKAESLSFEDRVKLGFSEVLSSGLDYFFGLSLVLSSVGDKVSQSANQIDIRSYLSRPSALARLLRGSIKARLAGRSLLPRDLWQAKGIITSGLDSTVYKEKIKKYWGRYPLDIYACTEGGIIATQTWDYQGMTFIPNLNFLEFIPEDEHFKWQADRNYQPKTILMDEVKAGQPYEIVITNFHGGSLMRYRIGDMVRITSLKNDNLGIQIPQMEFERRADDLMDFVVFRLTERTIWRAIQNTGIPYKDWVAYKQPGEPVLNILLELDSDHHLDESGLESVIYKQILHSELDSYTTSQVHGDLVDMINFKVKVTILPRSTFALFMAQREAEGADIAHLKPPHTNPSPKILSTLLASAKVRPQGRPPVAVS
jgi:hypothetical protein